MAAKSFTISEDGLTASQDLDAAASVIGMEITGGGRLTVQASHDDTTFFDVVSSPSIGSFGSYSGLFGVAPIPSGWHVRILAQGVTGTVVIQ